MSRVELKQLLKTSRMNNRRNGITGFLLYQGGSFIQLFEGPDRSVYKLWELIRRDNRHMRVTLILLQNIEQRLFQDWSMGFADLQDMPNKETSTADNCVVAPDDVARLFERANSNRTLDFLSSFRNKLNKHGDYVQAGSH